MDFRLVDIKKSDIEYYYMASRINNLIQTNFCKDVSYCNCYRCRSDTYLQLSCCNKPVCANCLLFKYALMNNCKCSKNKHIQGSLYQSFLEYAEIEPDPDDYSNELIEEQNYQFEDTDF